EVVYLAVELSAAAQRVGLNRDRPLLLGNPRAQLRALMDERKPLYEESATFTVDTTEMTSDQVAEQVVRTLRERAAR
ncbi:MAG TPA: shikimate kinase, partial [Mycobacteriales bacterium]|nr:shikimate kinase [Mycobacteriales bacterium]